MLKAGRLVPPIARLHDHRNELMAQVERLSEMPAARSDDRDAKLARAKVALDYVDQRRTQGYLVEFDYPYVPKVRRWSDASGTSPCGEIIAARTDYYRELLTAFLGYADQFTAIPAREPPDESQPFWGNPWLPPLDAICLSGIVTKLNPRRYVEIGSGNSTKYVRRAINDSGLRTKIISIDPYPRAVIDTLCDEVIRDALENVSLGLISDLGEDDVLFVDNSHRSFQNSDVTVFFTEILPALKSGCTYGIHDIFLPNDYPAEWLGRFYNEQYMLMAYLLGGAGGDDIVLPVHFVQQTPQLLSILNPIFKHSALEGAPAIGGAFWMRRG
jgi:hypothetical protein